MSQATAADYSEWISTLTGSDLAAALAAGLDKPLVDQICHGMAVMPFDGLPVFHKNGAVHPLQHEATRDHSIEADETEQDVAVVPELAAALRRVLEYVVRGMSPREIFHRSPTIAQRVFCVCRAVQVAGCESPSLADIAREVGLTRASLSKCCVEFRDALGNQHLHFGGREHARRIMRAATTRAWRRRKG